MAKKKSKSNKTKYSVDYTDKILPSEDLHDARIIGFVELGTQDTDYGDKFMVEVAIEIVDESAVFNEEDGEQNFVLYRRCTRSLGKNATLGKIVRAAFPGDIDDQDEIEMDELLGQPLRVQVEYDETEQYANMTGYFRAKGKAADAIPEPENETYSLYLDENFDEEVYDNLPDWKQEMIAESPEGEELGLEPPAKPKSKKGKKSKPTTKSSKKKVRDEEEEEEDEDDEPKSKRKTKTKTKNGKEDDDDEDEEDDEPKSKRRGKNAEPDEDEDEEEEEEPTKQRTRRKTAAKKTGRRR